MKSDPSKLLEEALKSWHDGGFATCLGGMLDWDGGREIMDKVEKIEQEVEALSPAELAQFRAWFFEYDGAVWDRQLERDVQAGRLDDLADEALREHAADKIARGLEGPSA